MSCVLRTSSDGFDVDAFLRDSPWRPNAVYRRGVERYRSRGPEPASGFNLEVSSGEFADFEQAVADAVAFLRREQKEVARLVAATGAFTLDFAVEYDVERAPFFSRTFPVELIRAAAEAGGRLSLSFYPRSHGQGGGSSMWKRTVMLLAIGLSFTRMSGAEPPRGDGQPAQELLPRIGTLLALREIADLTDGAYRRLLRASADSESGVRVVAMAALVEIGRRDLDTHALVTASLGSADRTTRHLGASIACRLWPESPATVDAVVALLREDDQVSARDAMALVERHRVCPVRTAPEVARLLESPDAATRAAAARCLAVFLWLARPFRSVLKKAAADADATVAAAARRTLATIGE